MSASKTLVKTLTAAALACAAVPALSASIGWSVGPAFGGPNGHQGILTNGTLVQAVNLQGGAGSAIVVDPAGLNISFSSVDSSTLVQNWTSAGTGGNTDIGWATILNSFEWQSGGPVTAGSFLSGLTVGNTYQVQFFAARSDCCADRTASYGDGAGHVSTGVHYDSYTSIVGTFVAGATTQTIEFIDSANSPVLNAYVLRDVTAAVPEPGTWALMGAGLLAVTGLARRRKS